MKSDSTARNLTGKKYILVRMFDGLPDGVGEFTTRQDADKALEAYTKENGKEHVTGSYVDEQEE